MRVFLKSSKTGRYYGDSGQLDAEFTEAIEFQSVQAATRHALFANLAGAEIALRCDYLSQEVVMPVVPEWCDLEERHTPELSVAAPADASASPQHSALSR